MAGVRYPPDARTRTASTLSKRPYSRAGAGWRRDSADTGARPQHLKALYCERFAGTLRANGGRCDSRQPYADAIALIAPCGRRTRACDLKEPMAMDGQCAVFCALQRARQPRKPPNKCGASGGNYSACAEKATRCVRTRAILNRGALNNRTR